MLVAIAIAAVTIAVGLLVLRKSSPRSEVQKLPAFVPEAPEGSMPRYGSRRWARVLFFNGVIDAAELNAFYAQHPEKLNDPDR